MFSIDIATVVAFIALCYAVLAYWASCKIWVKLLNIDGGFSRSIHEPELHYFDVVIQNLGLPLYRTRIWLSFSNPDGGSYSFEMERVEYSERHKTVTDNGEFAQGMIGAFRLKSTHLLKLGGSGIKILSKIECPKKWDARIQVHSQDFLVAEFRLWDRFYWIKSKWNSFAFKANRIFTKSDNKLRLNERKVFPTFNIETQWRLQCFVRDTVTSNTNK